jgi:hypothetical protein
LEALFLLMAPLSPWIPWQRSLPGSRRKNSGSCLGDPIVIVDVRTGWDWKGSDRKISGAVREEPNEAVAWAARHPKDKLIVLYCA